MDTTTVLPEVTAVGVILSYYDFSYNLSIAVLGHI